MNFLVVNDDGIEAAGIKSLVSALSKAGNVYVCAPDSQRSGKSHSITMSPGIHVKPATFDGATAAWMTDGTPADCTKVGLQFCKDRGIDIDIVFSGVNMGSNLGYDTIYSGTVGAAREAALQGYRAVAVSVNGHDASHFEAACSIALKSIDKVIADLPAEMILNINCPDIPAEEVKGVLTTRLGPNFYADSFNPKGDIYVLEGNVPDFTWLGDDFDVSANQNNFATITPIKCDTTEHELLCTLKGWEITI